MKNKEEKQIPLCRRCGKKLTSPKSRQLGMGEVCYSKFLREQDRSKLFTTKAE